MTFGKAKVMSEEQDQEHDADRRKVVDQIEEEYAQLVAYELSAQKWEELEAIEFNTRLIFPDALHVRKRDGSFEQVKVAFRVPRGPELREARQEARQLAAEDGIDEHKDRELFADLDTTCILWRAIRNTTAPYEPFESDVAALEKRFDRDVLKLAWAKLEGYRRVVDPRPAAITKEQVLAVVDAIAKRRDISPLHVFDGPAQSACVVFMASLLTRLGTLELSKPSSGS